MRTAIRPTIVRRAVALAAVCAVAVLAGCTHSSGTPSTAPSGRATGTRAAGGSASPSGPAPFSEQLANYDTSEGQFRTELVKVYPLQRVNGNLLLTVDLVPQGSPNGQLIGLNYFCHGSECSDMGGVSLVDTVDRVRYGPLRQGSADGTPDTSREDYAYQSVGTTYRYGGFFPDPGPSVTSMGVDLLFGGIVPDVPIVEGTAPMPGLVSDSATPGPSPSISATAGGAGGGPLVTWTVPQPAADAFIDRHDLIAKVVGGTVNEGGNRKQGIVTLNADVLFDFNSAKLTPQAGALVAQAAQILAGKADPAKPVRVTGYTDGKGTPSYNIGLSQARAATVATALHGTGRIGGLSLQVTGRGEEDPVAPNSLPDGRDNPSGRALNRRVEIAYTPKPAPAPSTTPTPAPTGATASASSTPEPATDPAVRLAPASVTSNGISPAIMSAAVYPITPDGTLTLVRLDITPQTDVIVLDAFSSHAKADQDIGVFTVTDPATKRVYIPAYDADNPVRVMGTPTFALNGGKPFHFAFYASALPPDRTSATVSLGQLGIANDVPITR